MYEERYTMRYERFNDEIDNALYGETDKADSQTASESMDAASDIEDGAWR